MRNAVILFSLVLLLAAAAAADVHVKQIVRVDPYYDGGPAGGTSAETDLWFGTGEDRGDRSGRHRDIRPRGCAPLRDQSGRLDVLRDRAPGEPRLGPRRRLQGAARPLVLRRKRQADGGEEGDRREVVRRRAPTNNGTSSARTSMPNRKRRSGSRRTCRSTGSSSSICSLRSSRSRTTRTPTSRG